MSLDRRSFLEALGVAGATALSGCINLNQEGPEYTNPSAEFLGAYTEEVESWTENSSGEEYSENLLIGEKHMIRDDGIPVLAEAVLEHEPDVVGLEFIYEEDSKVSGHNQGEVGDEELINHFNEVIGYERPEDNYRELLQNIEEANAEIKGLEPVKGKFYEDSGAAHVIQTTEERFRGMADNAEKLSQDYDRTVLFSGNAHVSKSMGIPFALLKASLPKFADNLSVEEVKKNPYVLEDENEGGFGTEPSFIEGKQEEFTYEGRLENTSQIFATSAREQGWDLYMVSRKFENPGEEVNSAFERARETLDDLEDRTIKGRSEHGFNVYLENSR